MDIPDALDVRDAVDDHDIDFSSETVTTNSIQAARFASSNSVQTDIELDSDASPNFRLQSPDTNLDEYDANLDEDDTDLDEFEVPEWLS